MDQIFLPGAKKDADTLQDLIERAFLASGKHSMSQFCREVCRDPDFLNRMLGGRVTPRKMRSAHDALVLYLHERRPDNAV